MRRSPRPGSTTSSQKHAPNFYSDNNSMNVTSEDSSSGHRSSGPEPGERESRKARGRSCGEPSLSAGVPGGTTLARSSRQKPMPRSHNALTAWGAETREGRGLGCGARRRVLARNQDKTTCAPPREQSLWGEEGWH